MKSDKNIDIDGFMILKSKDESNLIPKILSAKEYKESKGYQEIKSKQTKKDKRLIDTRKILRNNMNNLIF